MDALAPDQGKTAPLSAPANTRERLASVAMPVRIAALPRDDRGYPVPAFVQWRDGKPDFRLFRVEFLKQCLNDDLCWVCGQKFPGRVRTFAIGPMCCINRTTAEPPSHLTCAQYSAAVCPFLVLPRMHRLPTDDIPDKQNAGVMVPGNPGMCVLWSCYTYHVWRPDPSKPGVLLTVGDPVAVNWMTEGRPATRKEAQIAMTAGLDRLMPSAKAEGQKAVDELQKMFMRAVAILPPPPQPKAA